VIFVIEEDRLLRSLLVEWLTAEGYRVNVANGADTAMPGAGGAAVSTSDQSKVQLLIVDVFMPRGHGVERLRTARCAHPGVPVIAISGQFDPGIGAAGAAAAALNVDRVVAKPFEREAMLDAVRSLIGRPG
jgi:DNA-binding response OmpR family regulator